MSESERTSDGPIFPITREDTDFGPPFGHVVRASVASADDVTEGEAASYLLYIIHLNGLRPWGGTSFIPTSRSLSCLDLRLSGSTPGFYYPASWLGCVAICDLLTPVCH